MKKHKRIEITAFRRRVIIVSGEQVTASDVVEVRKTLDDGEETVGSFEGQKILREAIRLLKERVAEKTREDV